MQRRALPLLAGAAAGGLLGAVALTGVPAFGDGSHDHDADLLRAPLAGSQPDDPIFGVASGGLPWVVDSGRVRVRDDGRIRVEVDGLVIPGVGTGQVTTVSATLVCNGERGLPTAAVPLSRDGDARIRDRVKIPDRCIAPVLMVNPNGNQNAYIAISGREA
jgi:hypothetical protein